MQNFDDLLQTEPTRLAAGPVATLATANRPVSLWRTEGGKIACLLRPVNSTGRQTTLSFQVKVHRDKSIEMTKQQNIHCQTSSAVPDTLDGLSGEDADGAAATSGAGAAP